MVIFINVQYAHIAQMHAGTTKSLDDPNHATQKTLF